MTRAVLVLTSDMIRSKAADWCRRLPFGTRVEFKQIKRTLPQNDRMWAMLTDVSIQARHHGLKLTPDDWKLLFLEALGRELRCVPNLDGDGFVNLGRSSSDLSVEEMTNLIEMIFAYGAKHGVEFGDEARAA